MSASTWVPLVTAAVGLAAGLITGLASTVLTRRWASEDRAAAWQREDRLRWQSDRLQAYTRLISALTAWIEEPPRAIDRRRAGEPFDVASWERHDHAATELVSLVYLMAPEKVRGLAGHCHAVFVRTGHMLAARDVRPAAIRAETEEAALAISRLGEAMRADLGLGGDGQPVGGAVPRPAGRSGEPSPPDRPAG